MAELGRRYALRRPCGYKGLARYEEEGFCGLEERSRRPHYCPHGLDRKTEDAIVAFRRSHPQWGPRKLRVKLAQKYPGRSWPASSTIGEVLTRHGLTVSRRLRRRASPSTQPLAHCVAPNDVWSVDFKGWFRTQDGVRCDPLTLCDGASRYLLRCQAVASPCYEDTRGVMEAAFREYGLPQAIRSDNGEPFASVGLGGLSRLSVWWMRIGVIPERIRPGQPQENGRHERFHRTLKESTAKPPAATKRDQQTRFNRFRQEYNEERPHEALGQNTPASVYVPSPRPYPSRIRQAEYPEEMQTRTVHEHGQFRFQGDRIFLGWALQGERIGLSAIDTRYWLVYFTHILLGVVDVRNYRMLKPAQAQKRVPGYEEAVTYIATTLLLSSGGEQGGEAPYMPSPKTQTQPLKV